MPDFLLSEWFSPPVVAIANLMLSYFDLIAGAAFLFFVRPRGLRRPRMNPRVRAKGRFKSRAARRDSAISPIGES